MTTSNTTRELLRRYQRGELSALELLLGREIPSLRLWARGRLPSWARGVLDTADVVQDALTRTLPRLRTFEPRREKALRAYLRTAVANQIRNEARRNQRAPKSAEFTDEYPDSAPGSNPEAVAAEREDDRIFARAVMQLSPSDRAAVIARLKLGYTYDQIALLLRKRSVNAARMSVTRAVARLIAEITRLEQPPDDHG